MRKKDMYIRYKTRKHYSRSRVAAYILLVVALAIFIGFGIYVIVRKPFGNGSEVQAGSNNAQEVLDGDEQTASGDGSAVLDESRQTGAAGPFGMWYAQPSEEETDSSPYTEEIWMSDFVDTRTRVEAKGIYVSSAYAQLKLDDAIDLIDRTELNAIVIDVKSDSGHITYQMDYDMAREIGATTSTIADMAGFIERCKDHDIYLIARVVALKDPILAEKRPDLALKNKDGTIFRDNSGLAWVNPYEDEVWEYLAEVSKQCVEIGFDEINYDYIRFSTDSGMSNVDFGEESQELTRIDVITEGIRGLCELLKPMGVFVSCDVYGAIISSQVDARIVGQSYHRMACYLDYICPMVYPSHYGDGYYKLDHPDLHPYELVYNAMQDSKKVLSTIPDDENKAIVRPWLQDFTASWLRHYQTYGPEQLREQINAVYESGYGEWLLWNAAISYSEGGLEEE